MPVREKRGTAWTMDVEDLHYYIDSIRSTFRDDRRLFDLAKDLKDGKVELKNMRPIYVRRLRGTWYALKGNRRLYVLKKLKEHGHLQEELKSVTVRFFRGRKRRTAKKDVPLKLRGTNRFNVDIDKLLQGDAYHVPVRAHEASGPG